MRVFCTCRKKTCTSWPSCRNAPKRRRGVSDANDRGDAGRNSSSRTGGNRRPTGWGQGAPPREDGESAEPADKPGSVVSSHSSGIRVTAYLERPTRVRRGPRHRTPIWSCSGWGLPSRSVLPRARCALTAPFHPYLRFAPKAVYFLLHFPWAHAPQELPGTLPCGARTFLPRTSRERLPSLLRSRHASSATISKGNCTPLKSLNAITLPGADLLRRR